MTTISREEVAKHDQKPSGWFIINNEVFDVTHFYDDHPGGRDILLSHIGKDATEDFEAVGHSKGALKKLAGLKIGDLPENERRSYFTMVQVAGKKTIDNAWFVINNKVYDVTRFLDLHPGGRDILLYNAGGDATQAFTDNGHSDNAYKIMQKYFVGDLAPEERKKIVERKTHDMKGADGHKNAPRENESLLSRIQEELKFFIFAALFIMAGYFLLS